MPDITGAARLRRVTLRRDTVDAAHLRVAQDGARAHADAAEVFERGAQIVVDRQCKHLAGGEACG